jgi:hypothetical protein
MDTEPEVLWPDLPVKLPWPKTSSAVAVNGLMAQITAATTGIIRLLEFNILVSNVYGQDL